MARETKTEKVNLFIPFDNNGSTDMTVCVNGKVYKFQRGEYVEVPRNVARAIERSQRQTNRTIRLINAKQDEYKQESKYWNV